MKILHVIDSGGIYGAEVVLLALAVEQKMTGHWPCIASIGEKGHCAKPLETEAENRGLEVAVFRMHNGPNVLGGLQILRFARMNGFDVLHAHGYKGDILLGLLPRAIRRLPLVITVHGWTSLGGVSRLGIYEWADAISLRRADAVCLVNESMLDHPRIQALNRIRLHVVPNGISELVTEGVPIDDGIIDFCERGYTVASIGRLSPEKGYAHLLQAFKSLHNRHPDTRLLILGEGPERYLLEHLVSRLQLNDSVLLPGYRKDAWRYLAHCRIFVLASLTEGLPITLLEAMQMGIPIVATSVGGIPYVISHGDTGILVPPASSGMLGNALLGIYGDEDRSTCMARNAKDIATSRYSSSRMAGDYEAVYQGII